MIGDVIDIKPEYINTAREIVSLCGNHFFDKKRVILVAGESGSGKSVTAVSLQKVLLRSTLMLWFFTKTTIFIYPLLPITTKG